MSTNLDQICDSLSSLTVLELSELSKKLEDKWGVSAAAVVAPAAVAASAPVAAEAKDKFKVILESFGSNKIAVIKEVRAITGLGLKEAKELVESAPKDLKDDVSEAEAKEIEEKLKSAGATVKLS